MRWFKHSFANSLHSLLAQTSLTVRSQPTDCTEAIRQAMLNMLGQRLESYEVAPVVRRIRLAVDAQELWYSRDSLMSAVAQDVGESAARLRLATLDRLFEGQIPAALVRGRSPTRH